MVASQAVFRGVYTVYLYIYIYDLFDGPCDRSCMRSAHHKTVSLRVSERFARTSAQRYQSTSYHPSCGFAQQRWRRGEGSARTGARCAGAALFPGLHHTRKSWMRSPHFSFFAHPHKPESAQSALSALTRAITTRSTREVSDFLPPATASDHALVF